MPRSDPTVTTTLPFPIISSDLLHTMLQLDPAADLGRSTCDQACSALEPPGIIDCMRLRIDADCD